MNNLMKGRLGFTMRARLSAFCIVLLMLLLPLSGCLGNDTVPDAQESNTSPYPDINERAHLEWNWTGEYAMVLEPGPHYALDVQSAFIDVDTSEVWETGPAESQVHLSYWLPSNTQMEKRSQ